MSKLSKTIKANISDDYIVKPSRYVTTEIKMSPVEYTTGRIAKKVEIGVKISSCTWVNDDITKLPSGAYEDVIHDIKRGIIEEVFGEFRPLIIEIRTALYDEDNVRLRTLLAELEQQMFSVE